MKFTSWVTPTTHRIYQKTAPPADTTSAVTLEVACNERFSLQVAALHDNELPVSTTVTVQNDIPWTAQVRRVGYVPVRHVNTRLPADPHEVEGLDILPGYVPDPLFEESSYSIPPKETHSFWITFKPLEPYFTGTREIEIAVSTPDAPPTLHRVTLKAHPVRLEKPRFSITHWFYIDALLDWYRFEGLHDEAFWKILPKYLSNMTEHGLTTLFTPIFTPPIDGVKRPSQLLYVERLGEDHYQFQWETLKRYIDLGKQCGFRSFEWSHLFTQWGAKFAPRIYRHHGDDEVLLWDAETPGNSPIYRRFLEQFLPEFERFLRSEGILEQSFFHLSDEPHGDTAFQSYAEVRAIVKELAPWMRPIMDATSEYRPETKELMDIPIPSVSSALEFLDKGLAPWCYYCCIPRERYINRFLDTPLAKINMHGFLFYRWPFQGFLHWGHNYWYKSQTRELIDPFTVQDASAWPEWAFGDPFMVYPGAEGPIDSLRWELFSDSLQDYSLLQTLGVDRNDPVLEPIKSFDDFPKNTDWRLTTRSALFVQSQIGKAEGPPLQSE